MKRCLLISLGLVFQLLLVAQTATIRIESTDELPRFIDREYAASTIGGLNRYKREVIASLIEKGFLEASFDTCGTDSLNQNCQLHIGKLYKWAAIRPGNMNREVASQARFREKLYRNEPIRPTEIARLMSGLLEHFENNGFPFCEVRLDSIEASNEGLRAAINLKRNALVKIDSVVVKGNCKTANILIQEQIGITPGDIYDESKIRQVEKRLKELSFVRVNQAPYVLFGKDVTKLYLFLDDKKASSITGIVGVLPNEATGKITFTGDLDLHLKSALKRGETIRLKWRRLQDQTQDLNLDFAYPFLFNTPFGFDAGLSIYRRDTTFLDVNSRLGGSINLEEGDRLTAFVSQKSSSRLGQRNTFSNSLADTRTIAYGLSLHRDRTDYRRNPRRGHILELSGAVGRKRSQEISPLNEELPPEVKSVQYETRGSVALYLPIGKRSTIRTALQGGSMINELLFTNELFRIGGFRDIRGVDDVSILASSFGIATLEYRFLFEENSNFFLFADQAWWEDLASEDYLKDTPIAFGIGTNFETSSGIFSLSYALGRQFNNPIRFNNAKVHFGFASVF